MRPESRDIIKRIPKLRGYAFKSIQDDFTPINLSVIEATFSGSDEITPSLLVEKGVAETKGSKAPRIKILATGEVTKKFTFVGCSVSAEAKNKIEKAGGKVVA